MADGFLGRWAKRKEAVRRGEPVPAEPVRLQPAEAPPPQPSPREGGSNSQAAAHLQSQGSAGPNKQAAASLPPPPGEGGGGGVAAQTPPPTLEDTQSLTPGSDFTRFARPDVAPEVKNAALKKLFTDPHFNTMDGLDVYIDDYSKPDPLPPQMLRNLASAQFLKLFEDEEKPSEAPAATGEIADDPAAQNVAQSCTRTGPASPPAGTHADPDLRLQQDDAPGPAGPGAGAR